MKTETLFSNLYFFDIMLHNMITILTVRMTPTESKTIMKINKIFSYGTLQYPHVQQALLNREISGHEDALPKYTLTKINNSNHEAVKLSGDSVHFLAVYTGNDADKVSGKVYEIEESDLDHLDAYEVPDYQRVPVRLESDELAWLYVNAENSLTNYLERLGA